MEPYGETEKVVRTWEGGVQNAKYGEIGGVHMEVWMPYSGGEQLDDGHTGGERMQAIQWREKASTVYGSCTVHTVPRQCPKRSYGVAKMAIWCNYKGRTVLPEGLYGVCGCCRMV